MTRKTQSRGSFSRSPGNMIKENEGKIGNFSKRKRDLELEDGESPSKIAGPLSPVKTSSSREAPAATPSQEKKKTRSNLNRKPSETTPDSTPGPGGNQAAAAAAQTSQGWPLEDEVSFCNALLALVKAGKQMNTSEMQESVKGLLSEDYSKSRLYEKARRMKRRFLLIKDKLLKDPKQFSYKSVQEEKLYQIWSQIWGEDGDLSPDMDNVGGHMEIPTGSEEEPQHAKAPNRIVTPAIEKVIQKTCDLGGGFMKCGELRDCFGLNKGDGSKLEHKWRQQQISEIRVFSERLKLLQEECRLTIQHLQEKQD
eukprot:Gb_16700 [translate_table: standard]